MQKHYNFNEWLAFFIDVDLPIGDLAKDAQSNPLPNSNDYQTIKDHIFNSRRDPVVIETFEIVWKFYIESR